MFKEIGLIRTPISPAPAKYGINHANKQRNNKLFAFTGQSQHVYAHSVFFFVFFFCFFAQHNAHTVHVVV